MNILVKRSPEGATRTEFTTPRVSVRQDADGYTLEAEVPGVGKSGVEITVENGRLTLVGRRSDVQDTKRPVYRERSVQDYRRVFELDPSIDSSRVTASVDDGVLTIRLPKAEAVKPRTITVS